MRWKPKYRDRATWHSWFAWKPVRCYCGTWVWLELVLRAERIDSYHIWWEYKLPD